MIRIFCSIIQHVTGETTLKEGADVSVQPEKSLVEMEKELLGKFQVRIFHCRRSSFLVFDFAWTGSHFLLPPWN